jgi:hypothetical protein
VQQAATQPQPQIPGWSGSGYAANVPAGATPAPTVISDPTQAVESVGGKLAVQALTPVAEAAARAALISPFASAITIFVVDGATSTVELGVATWILQQIGVVTVSGKFS